MPRRLTTAIMAICAVSRLCLGAPVDVYFFGGQSNMQGLGRVDELPEAYEGPIEGARIWNGTAFEVITPGKTVLGSKVEQFGPELSFARAMRAAPGAPEVYIVKYWSSGKAIDHGWNHGKWLGDPPGKGRVNFYPGEKPGDPLAGTLYGAMLTMYRKALAHLEEQGIAYRTRGIVWMQGEQDSKNELSATRYAANLKRFYTRLTADLGIEPCPLVYGQVLPFEPPAERFTHRDEVRQSQWDADPDSGSPEAFPQAHMVSTDGLAVLPDEVHYTTASQLALGKRFAKEMQGALGDY